MLTLLFLVAIVAPAVSLAFTWSRTRTLSENRAMAPWPAPAFSHEFPLAFERAFSDRFGFRDALVRVHHDALLRFFGVSSVPTVMPAQDGWFYWLGEDGHSLDRHYRQTMPIAQHDVDATVAELGRRDDWLAARGIAHVVVVVPEKFTVYPEHLPSWVVKAPRPTPFDRVRDGLRQDGRVTFVDLRPALLAAKSHERVYYQTDSHWNYNGAVVAYEILMGAVRDALPGKLAAIAPAPRPVHVSGVDFYSGDLVQILALKGIREDDVAPFGKVVAEADERCAHHIAGDDPDGDQIYACNTRGLPRAVIMCDSMAVLMMPILSENFSRAVYLRSRTFDRARIEREQPDIVIEELVERGVNDPAWFPMD